MKVSVMVYNYLYFLGFFHNYFYPWTGIDLTACHFKSDSSPSFCIFVHVSFDSLSFPFSLVLWQFRFAWGFAQLWRNRQPSSKYEKGEKKKCAEGDWTTCTWTPLSSLPILPLPLCVSIHIYLSCFSSHMSVRMVNNPFRMAVWNQFPRRYVEESLFKM